MPEKRLLDSTNPSLVAGSRTSGLWRGCSVILVSGAAKDNKHYYGFSYTTLYFTRQTYLQTLNYSSKIFEVINTISPIFVAIIAQ
jgi:hypothetical protein